MRSFGVSSKKSFLRSRQDRLIVLGLIALSLGFYVRATQFGFVAFDDTRVLLGHPSLYDETSLAAGARAIFTEFPREEPLLLRDLSWAVDARVYGFENPLGYHLGNVVMNALVVALLFVLLRRWTHSSSLAGLVSLAFTLVPVHVEPVCWVMGRKDLLVAVAMLLGLLSQSIELNAREPRWRWLAYAGTLLCCVLALGSKISAIAFPLVLGLHRFFRPYLEEGCNPAAPLLWRAALLRSIPPVVPHALLSMAVFHWYHGVLSEHGGVFPSEGPAPLDPEHLLNLALFLPLIAGEYLKSLFLPYQFSISYRWPSAGIALSPMELAMSCLWALGVSASIGLALWKRRDLAFYGLFTLALLSPYIGLFYVGFWRADRYLYLAAAGLLSIAGIIIRDAVRLAPRTRIPAAAMVLVFLTTSGVTSWFQQEAWRSNETLWSYEIERTEPSLLAFQALAIEYSKRLDTAQTPDEKDKWNSRTEEVVKLGFARHRELNLAATSYALPEQQDLAQLYEVQNGVALYRGAAASERAQYLRRAFEVMPSARSAWLVAQVLYIAAETEPEETRDKFVVESLNYYEQLLAYSATNPVQLEKNMMLLDTHYVKHFPFLEDRVADLKSKYTQ
jgi:hypothetical protein